MTALTTTQLIQKYRSSITKIEHGFERAVDSVHALQTKRIFEDGLRADGGKIGTYNSTKRIYVNPKYVPKAKGLSGKGKTGKSKFKNGKPHKSTFFKSYKAFRASQGAETGFVNFKLFGHLQSDYRKPPVRIAPGVYVAGTSNPFNSNKVRHLIKRYGNNIFTLSMDERKELVRLATFERLKLGI